VPDVPLGFLAAFADALPAGAADGAVALLAGGDHCDVLAQCLAGEGDREQVVLGVAGEAAVDAHVVGVGDALRAEPAQVVLLQAHGGLADGDGVDPGDLVAGADLLFEDGFGFALVLGGASLPWVAEEVALPGSGAFRGYAHA
jgi:hypothetical protein